MEATVKQKLKSRLEEMQQSQLAKIDQSTKDVHSLEHGKMSDPLDSASTSTLTASLSKIKAEDTKTLNKINYALSQMKKGSYGICFSCGDGIDLKRLEAQPFSICCFDCQEETDKHNGRHRRPEVSYFTESELEAQVSDNNEQE